MYFTATSPYILMFVLLIRGLTLDGAMEGVKYYLLPEWEKLLIPQVGVFSITNFFRRILGQIASLIHHEIFKLYWLSISISMLEITLPTIKIASNQNIVPIFVKKFLA